MTIFTIDLFVSHLVQRISYPPLQSYLWWVSVIGNVIPLFIILSLCLLYFYFTKHQKAAIYLFSSVGVGVATSTLLKIFFARPRPTPDLVSTLVTLRDYSFPSSHCVSFTILFGFLYYYLTIHHIKKSRSLILRLTFLLLIFSVSVSRIYLGAHWLTDCLAGYFIGVIILLITIKKFKK